MITICLVNHNACKYTIDCIDSIKRNARQATDCTIIVVDNKSTDGSARKIKDKHPDVLLILSETNVGFATANNLAIAKARGEYVLLLNNDTVLRNDALTLLARFLAENPKTGIITCKLFEPDGKIQKNCRSFPLTPFDTMFGRASLLSKLFPNNPITKRTILSGWDYNSPRQVDWVSGACMMVRREVFDQIGLLDENFFMYWEDTDLCKRARDAGWEIRYTPEGEITHYSGQGGGNRSLPLKLFTIYQMHRSAYYYFRKHYYHNPLHPMALFAYAGMWTLVLGKSIIAILGYLKTALIRK
jgi:GT2 family glycosyltransferase